jgi:NitT/TauT family transport system ATP-binding protein
MLNVKNISKSYDDQLVLDGVSFSVKKGEVVAVMGASGSGKTTLLKALAGLHSVDSGSILFNKNKEYSKGFMAQKPSLLPWISVEKNIGYGLSLQNKTKKEIKESVESYIRSTQLVGYENYMPQDLSGGMQQRAALAGALVTRPDLLLMDEPLSALDTQTKSQIRDFVRDILVSEKQTTVIITHDPEEALYLADRIIILSPSPARVIDEIKVPFGSNRHKGIVYTQEFQDLKKYISYIMYAEAVRTTTDKKLEENKHLSIGSNIWVGTLPLYLSKELGLYEKNGIESYNLITLEWSANNRFMPINEGLVDVLNMTLDMAMVACESNPDLRILLPLDVSSGGDALISRGGIKSISDISKKKIAVEKDWIGGFFLDYILKENGLKREDVEIVDMPSKDTPKALISGEVDAAVIQEPWLSEVSFGGEYKVLASSSDYPVVYATMVTTQSVVEEKGDLIDGLVSALQESISLVNKDKKGSVRKTAHILGSSENFLLKQLENVTFLEKNNYSKINKDIDEIESVLLDSGMLKKPFDRSKLLFN